MAAKIWQECPRKVSSFKKLFLKIFLSKKAKFTGKDCEQVDTCFENPCRNNATCLRMNNTAFECLCASDLFTGPLCNDLVATNQTNITSNMTCLDNPCVNNAACVDLSNSTSNGTNATMSGGGFECQCLSAEFSGRFCEVRRSDPCEGDPCRNGATCFFEDDSFRCMCAANFTGSRCEVPLSCTHVGCLNNGTCTADRDGLVKCNCVSGFGGGNCEIDLLPCKSQNCSGRGECALDKKPGEYFCTCERK